MADRIPTELLSLSRPLRRADCQDGPRPCPWVSCRHHLADLARDWLPEDETCSLDVADRTPLELAEIAPLVGYSRSRVQQLVKDITTTGALVSALAA